MTDASAPLMRTDGHPVVLIPANGYFARLHHRLRDRLPMWIVYRPVTREYPGLWVARMRVTLPADKPTRFVMTHDSLEELRTMLPPGLFNLGRKVDDVPEIEEAWV